MGGQNSQETKHKILEAARKHFIQFGFDGARMQAIAEDAKVNKALLHYYFKDKQQLYQEVFEFALVQIKSGFAIFQDVSLTIHEKIIKFSKFCLNLYKNHSDIMIFLVCEIHRSSDALPNYLLKGLSIHETDLSQQIQSGMSLGLIKKSDINEILTTILGLCLFPIITYDFNTKLLGFSVGSYPILLESYYEKLPDKIMNFIKL
jgi:AcrR family transcriptional regulator